MINKAREAAVRYLTRKGYEVRDIGFEVEGVGGFDVIASDPEEECLAFINVTVSGNGEFEQCKLSRAKRERVAISWLCEREERSDMPVCFDEINFCVFDKERALLRHYHNVLSHNEE